MKTIIVVGAGGGGLAAAIGAASHGVVVHLIDKQSHIGGMLHIANGEFSGAGSRRQRECGIDDSPQRHFDEVVKLSHGHINSDLAWLSVRHQGETVDWLDDQGFDFHDDCPGLIHGHEVYDVPRTYWGVEHGRSVLRVLDQQLATLIESGHVHLHLETTVTELIRDGEQVVGVQAQSTNGDDVTISGDAVVFATGGYDANLELRNRFMPEHCHSVLIGCLDHATGDGLLMAEQIGAAVSSDGIFLPVMGLIPDPHRPGHAIDYREAFVEMAPAYRTPHEIWVNTAGERFVAEDTRSPERRERALIAQPDNTMHVIFDARTVEAAPVSLIRNPADEWSTERFAEACRSSDWVTRGETIGELATALNIDPIALAATVARFNTAVESGTDEFGRDTFVDPIDQGPFYAITTVAASILSRDGVAADTDLRVLDTSGQPISGLYAVGEILGNNVFAGDNYVGGMSITPALTLGRILGERLAGAREGAPAVHDPAAQSQEVESMR